MFFSNHGSNDILFVVNIPRSFDSFFSVFFLVNWFPFNVISINGFVLTRNKFNLDIFLFDNWLDNRLINVFVCRKRKLSSINIVLNLGLFVDGFQCLFDFSTFENIKLFSNLFNSRLYNILVNNLISINCNSSWFKFVLSLNWQTFLSFNNSVFFLHKFRN